MLRQLAHTLPVSARDHALWLRLVAQRIMTRAWEPLRNVLRRPVPARACRLVQAMPAPLLGARARGADICRGRWRLAGHEVQAHGTIIFDRHDVASDWLAELHGFDWLQALLAQPNRLWMMRARTLLLDWLDRHRRHALPGVARRPAVLARRVINWTSAAPLLLADADEAFAARFMAGLAGQHRALLRAPLTGLTAADRLEVFMARAWAALALDESVAARAAALEALAAELGRQILPDGAHVSRCGQRLLELTSTLLPLRRAAEQAGLEVPAAMHEALERALPMLRMLMHADGGLALFHGGDDTARGLLRQVLEHDIVAGAPLRLAPHGGFARLEGGQAVAIVDVGPPPGLMDNPAGALSALALEFSADGQRIITSCGAPLAASMELREVARLSAAHSMPVVDDEDAGQLFNSSLARWLTGRAAATGPWVEATMRESDDGLLLQAEHDAWVPSHGLRTRRRLFLSGKGDELRGEDSLLPAPESAGAAREATCTLRFHLHPSITASLARDGRSVMLVLPNRGGWLFSARGAHIALEESALLAGGVRPRRSVQIVLRARSTSEAGCRINWRLRRQSAPRRRRKARAMAVDTPGLPLQQG